VHPDRQPNRKRLIIAAILLGVGLGALFDGIVLHQILQWHHMVSARTPPDTLADLELNTFGDGVFHVAAWIVTIAGVFALMSSDGARNEERGTRTLIGGMLVGWGLFNTVEGLIDHQLLNLHHVRPGPDEVLYDAAYLGWGVAMLIVGMGLVRHARPKAVRGGRKQPYMKRAMPPPTPSVCEPQCEPRGTARGGWRAGTRSVRRP
jgi:uncharacterized membrane protein